MATLAPDARANDGSDGGRSDPADRPLRQDGAVFTEEDLLDAAGPAVFERGVEYLRYVRGLQVHVEQATASIQAKRVYTVRLAWFGHALDGACSCPHNSDGNFCKHLVAVGLAVLDAETDPLVGDHEGGVLSSYLDGLDHASLVDLVNELIAQDESAFRLVQAHAVEAGSAAVDPDELTRAVSAAMPRGFVDYRASFDAARDAAGSPRQHRGVARRRRG